ncbi:MAG: hypothetical protein IJ756_06490 [Paludibacteraceae bacterium]|nr:hypothetical protein [Paludibacteraceae bacterium]
MKLNTYLFLCITILMLSCCSDGMAGKKKTKEQTCNQQKGKQQLDSTQLVQSFPIQPDDSVRHILGDCIADIIFNSDSVRLLELSLSEPNTLENDTTSGSNDSINVNKVLEPTFHECYIKKDFGNLTQQEVCLILFILSDKSAFFSTDIGIKSAFIPDVALSFYKKGKKVDMIFSFNGGQLEIYKDKDKDNDNYIYKKYKYERLIALFFQRYLQQDNLQLFIEKMKY